MSYFFFILILATFIGFVAWKKGLFGKAAAKIKGITNPAPSPVIEPQPAPVVKPQPAPVVKPQPAPFVEPQPAPVESNELQESYTSLEALKDFIKRTGFNTAVTVDGDPIHTGFGPAVNFESQLDGSLRR